MRVFLTRGRQCVYALVAAFTLLLGACEQIAPPQFSEDIDDLLAGGREYATALATIPAAQLGDEDVVALGYLERARVGLGSPFRLISYVERDPRLSPETRESLAYAILGLTLQGEVYRVDPAVLDGVLFAGVPSNIEVGPYHLQLIEETIREASSPRSGERAVRLGYGLARAEQSIGGIPESVVAPVAALVADRYEARADAADLLQSAAALRKDPLLLLEEWRSALRFRVERPSLASVLNQQETQEVDAGLQVALSLRLLKQRLSAPVTAIGGDAAAPSPGQESWLDGETAERLMELADSLNAPPKAPVAVAVAINEDAFTSRPNLEAWQQEEREAFVAAAWNEERLIAHAALLRGRAGADPGVRLSLIELQAAVFLRGWNQEEPWFPGDPGPAAKDVEARFGLEAIVFGSDVPKEWHPYYQRVFARALTDLQSILPTASFHGLTLRVGEFSPARDALALHDPRDRTIVLPPKTGAGTLAHEIAHDLDWQLARTRYQRRGGYATDLAVQYRPQDPIAASVHGLAASFMRDPDELLLTAHVTRPAEVFARGVDWFVAAALAREGRMGGFLTSYQDPAITGYGSTRSPNVGGATVPTLFAILEHVAPVVPATREWALDRFGPARTISSMEIVQAINRAGAGLDGYEHLIAIEQARDMAVEGLAAASCVAVGGEDARRFMNARRDLIRAAAGAAARGVAISEIRATVQELAPEFPRDTLDAWLAWKLYGAPEPAANSILAALEPVFEPLLQRAADAGELNQLTADVGFSFHPPVTICAGNPFSNESGRDVALRSAVSR